LQEAILAGGGGGDWWRNQLRSVGQALSH
jgi:hypothetical protein